MNILNISKRIHFLLVAGVALAILVDLTSTVATAGLRRDVKTETAAPLPAIEIGATSYLEDDPEFAPKFKPVVARGRPVQRRAIASLACTFSIARLCVLPARA
jgi:hypothetical protein